MTLQSVSERGLAFKWSVPVAFVAALAPGIYLINQSQGEMSSQAFTNITAASLALLFGLIALGMVVQMIVDHFAQQEEP